tara:strand:+ start:133 stop:420 length:288 start_codon:yes stop_codon:yes gene_type:complete
LEGVFMLFFGEGIYEGKCATMLVFLGLSGLCTFGFSIDLTLEIDFLGVKAGGLIGLFGVLFAIIFTGEAAFLTGISSLLLLVDSLLSVFCWPAGL